MPQLVRDIKVIPLSADPASLAARQATYVTGSGTESLTFRYVVQAGDALRGRNGLGLAKSILLPASPVRARITDLAGNAATARNARLSAPRLRGIVIDGTAMPATATNDSGRPVSAATRAAAFAALG